MQPCLPLATQLQKSASITFREMLPADGRKWEKEPRRWRDRMKIAARDRWTAATQPAAAAADGVHVIIGGLFVGASQVP